MRHQFNEKNKKMNNTNYISWPAWIGSGFTGSGLTGSGLSDSGLSFPLIGSDDPRHERYQTVCYVCKEESKSGKSVDGF